MKEEPAAAVVQSVRELSAEIATFLANSRPLLQMSRHPLTDLSDVQGKLGALMQGIQEAGRRLREAELVLNAGSKHHIEIYVHHLEQLRQFMTALGNYAEARQIEIAAHSRELSKVKSWCDTVKLSSTE